MATDRHVYGPDASAKTTCFPSPKRLQREGPLGIYEWRPDNGFEWNIPIYLANATGYSMWRGTPKLIKMGPNTFRWIDHPQHGFMERIRLLPNMGIFVLKERTDDL